MSAPHVFDVQVYYEDTDFSGYVYHASYLRFMERGRTEFLRSRGVSHTALHRDEAGLVFVVARICVDYHRPARMDDMLAIVTHVIEARGPVLKLKQEVRRAEERIVSGEVTVATIRDGRLARMSESLLARLSGD